MKAGIGKVRYLNATGIYQKFIGIECQYAVNYMNNKINFLKQICELPNGQKKLQISFYSLNPSEVGLNDTLDRTKRKCIRIVKERKL